IDLDSLLLDRAAREVDKLAGVNIVFDREVIQRGTRIDALITLHATNVTVDEVMYELIRQARREDLFGYRAERGLIRVATKDALRRTRVFRVYVVEDIIESMLPRQLQRDAASGADSDTNVLDGDGLPLFGRRACEQRLISRITQKVE